MSIYNRNNLAELANVYKPGILVPDDDADIETVGVDAGAGSNLPSNASTSDAAVTVKIRFFMEPPDAEPTMKPIKLRVQASHPFRKSMEVLSERLEVPREGLVFTYNGVKLFPNSTPAVVNMTDGDIIEVYTTEGHEQYKAHREEERQKMRRELAQKAENCRQTQEAPEPDETAAGGADTIGLKLQDGNQVIKIKARATTLVEAVIGVYLKRRTPLPPNKTVRLCLDGETLDPKKSLADLDIEDGDMLEVRS
ncbi:hypothetical protein HK104_001204 [Borealophlyctis nickersoniae]|nr:hypothetical protein HK104_001204 [Borealophlyctis nickersoniae]